MRGDLDYLRYQQAVESVSGVRQGGTSIPGASAKLGKGRGLQLSVVSADYHKVS
jgi:hypothetical protein